MPAAERVPRLTEARVHAPEGVSFFQLVGGHSAPVPAAERVPQLWESRLVALGHRPGLPSVAAQPPGSGPGTWGTLCCTYLGPRRGLPRAFSVLSMDTVYPRAFSALSRMHCILYRVLNCLLCYLLCCPLCCCCAAGHGRRPQRRRGLLIPQVFIVQRERSRSGPRDGPRHCGGRGGCGEWREQWTRCTCG